MGVYSELDAMDKCGESDPPRASVTPFQLEKNTEEENAGGAVGLAGFEDEETQAAEADAAPEAMAELMEEKDTKNDVAPQPGDPGQESEAEARKRREHEEAEAKRKAEWEAKQQAKKAAEQEQLYRLAAMNDDDVMMASMKRVGDDTERLTRRNMKHAVTEHIQTKCLEDVAFARLTMHPRKSMVHCFWYINRKAREFIEREMKDNQVKPEGPYGAYGSDVPDDLCYQWAEDYFRDADAEEDREKEEKFVPKAYTGRTVPKSKAKKETVKKEPAKKPAPKKDDTQLTLDGLDLLEAAG